MNPEHLTVRELAMRQTIKLKEQVIKQLTKRLTNYQMIIENKDTEIMQQMTNVTIAQHEYKELEKELVQIRIQKNTLENRVRELETKFAQELAAEAEFNLEIQKDIEGLHNILLEDHKGNTMLIGTIGKKPKKEIAKNGANKGSNGNTH